MTQEADVHDEVAAHPDGLTDAGLTDRSWRARFARLIGWGMLGPAFVAAIAYVDPGNVAANLQAGAKYGYLLVWVLVLATATAGLVQYLSAKLGVVTGKSLPELVGERLRPVTRIAFWLQAEAVAVATDLAEVVGGAIALHLLFNLPLLVGGLIAGVVSMAVLMFQDIRGQRPFERVITGMLLIIAVGFIAGLFVSPPSPSGVAAGLLPQFDGTDSMMLATAMFGATVMPHVVYLHSALSRDRFGQAPNRSVRSRLLKATRADVTFAMILAGTVNIAMLLLAASALQGQSGVDTIEGAHAAVEAHLGAVVGLMFAIGLLVSGLASTAVGCYAGSVIMQGLIKRRISLPLRRIITLIPALVVLAVGAEPTAALVLSQVVLSFGLPFALVPLLKLTSSRTLMHEQANALATKIIGWAAAVAIAGLNIVLIVGVISGA
ncbi:manganese transport protein [Nakamurella panacisegetis]|uniref:Manganese transport protein n=2 Tax=Nakamurella panacisegetis TaxID=1090615 RepID=A0A1H0KZJ8_9ACTN|nr:Nramp family divalent metal transporter [Nakamurella panacisegetis]SDO61474.1 manganese transport protein [Nakamurella panacisegetis]